MNILLNSDNQFTLWCGLTSSSSGGIILTASCRLMLPQSVSDMRKLWRRKYASERRMSFRVNCSCHASPSGYLSVTNFEYFAHEIQRNYIKSFLYRSGFPNLWIKQGSVCQCTRCKMISEMKYFFKYTAHLVLTQSDGNQHQ